MKTIDRWTTRAKGDNNRNYNQIVKIDNEDYKIVLRLRNIFDGEFRVDIDYDFIHYAQYEEWVNVFGKVIEVDRDVEVDSIAQKGVIETDDTTIGYTLWESADCSGFIEGETYWMDGAVVDDYQGDRYLSINSQTDIHQYTDEYEEFVDSAIQYAIDNCNIPTEYNKNETKEELQSRREKYMNIYENIKANHTKD